MNESYSITEDVRVGPTPRPNTTAAGPLTPPATKAKKEKKDASKEDAEEPEEAQDEE